MFNFIFRRPIENGARARAFVRFIAVLTFGLAALMLWMASDSDRGLPPEDQLVSATGRLARAASAKYSVRFYLDGHEQGFSYSGKMGRRGFVRRSLKPIGAQVSLKYHPDHQSGPIYSDERYFRVFHLSVNGKVIRSYDQIRQSWISDNEIGLWAGSAFAVLGLYLWSAAAKIRPEEEDTNASGRRT